MVTTGERLGYDLLTMSRITLVHWNGQEARPLLARLRKAGHRVTHVGRQDDAQGYRKLRDDPPELFLIDLDRTPSHGSALGVYLRQQKPTRKVPILFVGGQPEKVERVRELLPDACYGSWRTIRRDLDRALKSAPDRPVVPDTMSGYSGTPLSKKLGITAESVLTLIDAPVDFEQTLGPLPERVTLRRQARGRARRVILFARTSTDLQRRFATAVRAVDEGGGLWIAWPKKSSGIATDLAQAEVRRTGLDNGLVDYKICAIDPTWSGLLFSRRR